jgi:hypothetical protein
MPPTDPVDVLYAGGIDRIAKAIGYQAAYEALMREFATRSESTMRHLFSDEGAAMNDIAEIVRRYPEWNIGFVDDGDAIHVQVKSRATSEDQEAAKRGQRDQIACEIKEVLAKYNKVPSLFAKHISMDLSEVDAEDSEE